MSPEKDLSVIICTYNRIKSLLNCLNHLSGQQGVDDLCWEVVVVDNNSTDGTKDVLNKTIGELPLKVRYVFEARQGLNHARNLGIMESKGKYLVFLDDDIIVSKSWIAAIWQAFKDNDADAVGGRIHFEKSLILPPWITPDMYGFLGYQDFGDAPFQMDLQMVYPFGGSMAFNRRVFDKIGLFNTEFGRKGSDYNRKGLFKGAETEYFKRLAEANGRVFYQPRALVYHQVEPFSLKKKHLRTIHYNAGYQMAFYDRASYKRNISGIPLFIFPQVLRAINKYFIQVFTKGPNGAFRQQMTACHFAGRIKSYFNRWKNLKNE